MANPGLSLREGQLPFQISAARGGEQLGQVARIQDHQRKVDVTRLGRHVELVEMLAKALEVDRVGVVFAVGALRLISRAVGRTDEDVVFLDQLHRMAIDELRDAGFDQHAFAVVEL